MKNLFFLAFLLVSVCSVGQNTSFTRIINNDSADNARAGFQVSNGDYFTLSTTTEGGQGGVDFQVTRTNGLGASLWSYTYGTSNDDIGTAMKPTTDGGVVVCGSSDGLSSNSYETAFITKINSSGTIQWTKTLQTDSNSRALDVIQAQNGVYYVTGYVKLDTMGTNMLASRIDGSGSVSWIRSLGGDGDDVGNSLVEDAINRIVIAGSTSNDSVNVGSTGDVDMSFIALNTGGTVLLSKNIGTSSNDEARVIKSHSDNFLYVAGNTDGGSFVDTDVLLMKMDTNFSVSSSAWYGVNGSDRAEDFIITDNDELLVTSSSVGTFSGRDIYVFETINFAPAFNAGVLGGTSLDANYSISLTGNEASGYSILSSGTSFGSSGLEDLYITKLNTLLEGECGYMLDMFNYGGLSLSSDVFSNSTTIGSNTSGTLTRATVTNSDSILCCKLEARVASSAITMCVGENVNIGRQGISGYQYSWTTLSGNSFTSSSANPNVSPTETTEYKLVVSSADGVCAADSATVMVTVNQRQTQVFFSDTIFCEGDSILLTAQSGMNVYAWNYDNGAVSGATLNVKKPGEITLYMIDNNSCQYRDTLEVDEQLLPVFSLGNDTTICDNLSITLTGPTGMASYNWNGTVGTSNMLTTNVSQNHTLTVTDGVGCEYTDDIQVLTNPSSSFSLGNDTSICEGTTLNIFIPAVLSNYKWNGIASTSTSFTVNGSGTYFAEATNSFDCPSYDTIVVSELAAPSFSLGNDTGFCDEIVYTLSGPAGADSYKWSDESDNQTLDISAVGEYFLDVVGSNSCTFSDTINIELYTSPTISLGNDTIIPASGTLTLTPGPDFDLYDWSTGESSESINVTDTGVYSVTVTDTNGCMASDEIWVPSTATVGYINGVKYSVYPNPASSNLILSVENSSATGRYMIIDVRGREVLSSFIVGSQKSIDVSDLENGLYKLILLTEDKSLTFSVLIAH